MNYATPIKTIDQAKAFIEALNASGNMFHFEDSPEGIISSETGGELFTLSECKKIRTRVRELYSFQWGEFDCPIGYALHLMLCDEFTDEFFRAETHGGGTMGWVQLTKDEKVCVMITNSDGCDLDLAGPDDFFIVGAYDVATGDSLLDDGVEDGGTTPSEAIAKAKQVAAQFGGF